jgi:hypothetical protein
MDCKHLDASGTTKTQIREFGASTRFKGSKTIYMLIKEEEEKKKNNS